MRACVRVFINYFEIEIDCCMDDMTTPATKTNIMPSVPIPLKTTHTLRYFNAFVTNAWFISLH